MALKSVSTYGDQTTSTTPETLTFDNTDIRAIVGRGGMMQLEITVLTAACIINTAGGTADATLTAGKLAAGNSYAAAGTVRTIEAPTSLTGVSYRTLTGTGEIWINVGDGERA